MAHRKITIGGKVGVALGYGNVQKLGVPLFTARSSYASADSEIVILSVRLSVRPSVTRVHCDEMKECTADISILHER